MKKRKIHPKTRHMVSVILVVTMAFSIISSLQFAFADVPVADGISGGANGVITAFDDLDNSTRYQKNTLDLPEKINGMVNGQTVEIPVRWSCDWYDEGKAGFYVFDAIVGNAYTVENAVDMPVIAYLKGNISRMVGLGTAGNPLEVTTASQLAEISNLTNSGSLESFIGGTQIHFKLINDINLSPYGKKWTPIGRSSNPFHGVFDGNSKTITNLCIDDATLDNAGLFGVVDGKVSRLNIENADINAGDYVGIVAGQNNGEISGCYVSGVISGGNNLGRIVGSNNSILADNYAFHNLQVNGSKRTSSDPTSIDGADKGGASGFESGTGILGDPYIIKTADQLAFLADQVNSGTNYPGEYIKLGNNIDLSSYAAGEGWNPIGYMINMGPRQAFQGNFDGDGHTITNLSMNRPNENYIALFGYNSGTIENIGIENCNISGNNYVSGVVATNNGRIYNSYSTGSISGNNYISGIVALNVSTTVSNCYSTSSVSGNSQVGGIVGDNYGTVSNCYSIGLVSGSTQVGGIVGTNNRTTIKDCVALNPSVIATSGTDAGRITGINGAGTINGNYAYSGMTVNGNTVAGGSTGSQDGADKSIADIINIPGDLDLNSIFGSPWTTATNSLPGLNSQIVPLPPHLSGIDFEGSGTSADPYLIKTSQNLRHFAEKVNSGTDYYGDYFVMVNNIDLSFYKDLDNGKGWEPIGNSSTAFRGNFDGGGHIITNLIIDRPNENYIGLFGYNSGTIENIGIENCSISGNNYVSGIAANNNGRIYNCYSTGSVSGNSQVGGIAGQNFDTIQNCYSTVSVSGNSQVGGIAGQNFNITNNCYSTGSVFGNSQVGGIVGGNSGSTENCVALNPSVIATGNADIGRVVGLNNNTAIPTSNNYAYDIMTLKQNGTDKTPIDDINGTDGASINKVKAISQNLYKTTLGWDFSTDWSQSSDKLPILQGFSSQQNGDFGMYLTRQNMYFSDVTVNPIGGTFTGSAHNPTIVVKFGEKILSENSDYSVEIKNSSNKTVSSMINVGTYTIEISGKNNYTGINSTKTYTISPASSPSDNNSGSTISSETDTTSSVTRNRYSYDGYDAQRKDWNYVNDSDDSNNGFQWMTLTHEKTGVRVSALFKSGAKLDVETLTISDSIVAFDISVNGAYKGDLTVSIPITTKYNGQELYVVHEGKNGTDVIKSTVSGGMISVKVADLSPFIVKQNLSENQTATSDQSKEFYNPKTGGGFIKSPSQNKTWAIVNTIIFICSAVGLVLVNRNSLGIF